MFHLKALRQLFVVVVTLWSLCAHSAEPEVTTHPWQSNVFGTKAEAYFSNLENGASIETPYLLKFGLAGGWGVSPIDSAPQKRAGHHHLLVNRELPLDFTKPLPFNENYIHFGAGQMETTLNLPPGQYTLRLVLADNSHIPNFVYSKPLSVTVSKKNETKVNVAPIPGIEILNLVNGQKFKQPFRVQFHASGIRVAPKSQQIPNSGYFVLKISTKGSAKPQELEFPNGQTEIWLNPPKGEYQLALEMRNSADPSKLLAKAPPVSVVSE
jgi:hypothetical protein